MHPTGVAAKRQIFAPREAFQMLSRELLDFYRSRSTDYAVDTVGDDVYHWVVDLGSFDPASDLAKVRSRVVPARVCHASTDVVPATRYGTGKRSGAPRSAGPFRCS